MNFRKITVVFVALFSIAIGVSAEDQSPPKVDHILLEVVDLKKSLAFYHDFLGLQIKSQRKNFVVLESGNVDVFLSTTHWSWDEKRPTAARPGWGCIRISRWPMSQQRSSARAKRVTKLRKNHGNTFGERKPLSLILMVTFGRSSTRRNRNEDRRHISYKRGTKRSGAARPQLQQGEFALR